MRNLKIVQAATWLIMMGGALAKSQLPMRINVGGASKPYTAVDGTQWSTDRYFSGGDTLYTGNPIAGTSDRYLYGTARYGLYGNFGYNIPVPNGSYKLTLKFAEIQYTAKGARVFNVTVNGAGVLTNFDILNEVAAYTALDKSFPVNVTDGYINIQFTGVMRYGIVNGILIEASSTTISVSPSQVTLGPGGTQQFTATVGGTNNTAVTWSASQGTVSSTGLYTAPATIAQAGTATVTATSATGVSANATVNLTTPVKVTVSPASGSVVSGGTLQLTASVTGTANTAVTWSTTAGTVSSTGLFTAPNVTAPATAAVTAKSVVDPTATAVSQITVNPVGSTSGVTFLESGGMLSMEAEHGTIVNRGSQAWVPRTNFAGFSGSSYLITDPVLNTVIDSNWATTSPEVQFRVNIQTTGYYTFWVRGYSTGASHDSVHIGLDGDPTIPASRLSNFTEGQWMWSDTRMDGAGVAYVKISSPGVHVVNVWMREDGFGFDKLVMAISTTYVPSGAGPSESPVDTGGPVLSTTPSNLSFSAASGSNPAAQNISVSNLGSGTLSWTASANQSWLSVSPASGVNNGTVAVSVNSAGLAAGNYTGAVTISDGATAKVTNVSLSVISLNAAAPVAQPVLSVSPLTLSFGGTAGASSPGAQSISISNTGGGTLSWTVSDDQNWLSASPASGSGNGSVSVAVNTSGLAAGTYSGNVTVTASGATNSPQNVKVTLTLSAPAAPSPGSDAGRVLLIKRTSSSFDQFTNSTDPSVWQWMRDHFTRMAVFSPYFDSKTSSYGSTLVYDDSYAIYTGSSVENDHPDWILKDASGNKLYIPWGCGGGSCPQRAADFSNPSFRQWWVDQAKIILARGNYKGLWIDDVNMDWRVSDGNGNFVNPIDRNTGQPMTQENWRKYMAEFMEKVRSDIPGVEILHNSIWYAGGDNGRDSDPYIARQIAAADIINIEFGVNDGGLGGGTGEWSVNAVLSFIDRLLGKSKRVVIEGIAGGDPNNQTALEYAIASYFLVSTGSVMAGDYSNVVAPDHYWVGLDANLGTPSGARYTWNYLLRRDFTGGMVLTNEPGAPTRTVTLPGTYKKVDGTAVTSVTLGARQGIVLTR